MRKEKIIWYKDENKHPFINNKGAFVSEETAHARDSFGDAKEWKEHIIYAMEKGYPSEVFCRTNFSAAQMDMLLRYLYSNMYVRPAAVKLESVKKIMEINHPNELWTQTCLVGLAHGICIPDILDKAVSYSPMTLWYVIAAYWVYDTNLCKKLNKGEDPIKLYNKEVDKYNKEIEASKSNMQAFMLSAKFDASLNMIKEKIEHTVQA